MDSDYFVYDSAGYAPLETLEFDEDNRRVSGVVYTRAIAAAILGCVPEQMPLIAALSRNDFTLNRLDGFHSSTSQSRKRKTAHAHAEINCDS